MRIEKLEIENFRGFKGKHTVEFQSDVNVFVGMNGAGKSSILDLIGMFIYWIIEDKAREFKLIKIHQDDINIESNETLNKIFITDKDNMLLPWVLNFELNLVREKEEDLTSSLSMRGLREIFKLSPDEIINDRINIPIVKYFGIHNIETSNNKDIQSDFTYNQLNVYKGFYTRLDNFKHFIQWFINQENIENRDKIRQRNLNHEDPFLKPVRDSISIFLRNFHHIKFENLRVENIQSSLNYSSHNLFDLCIDKNGLKFNLSQLSSGEHTIILIVAEIARRLTIANPSLTNPLLGTGIVLIDEIETHLHPAWQREVIPALTKTFPNIQFFFTTHSPQVLSNIDRKNVFIIEDFQFKKSPHTLGRDSNSILDEVFGVSERPEKYQKEFEELYRLIDNPDTADEAGKKLKQMIQEFGTNDPEIERAKMHYEFLTEKTVD
jgi:predicted ATP-binding protein involved in virulence